MGKKRVALLRRVSLQKRGPRAADAQQTHASADDRSDLPASSLYRLMAWLSPAYPVGAFSYSSGLEWAVEAGDVTSADELSGWLQCLLTDGAGYCDAVLFARSYRVCSSGDDRALREAAELAAALAPSRERFLETTAQGRAFLDVTQAAWPCELSTISLKSGADPSPIRSRLLSHRQVMTSRSNNRSPPTCRRLRQTGFRPASVSFRWDRQTVSA
jgi:hypothetical protein